MRYLSISQPIPDLKFRSEIDNFRSVLENLLGTGSNRFRYDFIPCGCVKVVAVEHGYFACASPTNCHNSAVESLQGVVIKVN